MFVEMACGVYVHKSVSFCGDYRRVMKDSLRDAIVAALRARDLCRWLARSAARRVFGRAALAAVYN